MRKTIIVNCLVCNKQFEGFIRRFPPKYCSDKCKCKGQLLQQNKWRKKMREIKRMTWLRENQQFRKDMPILLDKEECWVCGSKEKLILHHVKYFPKVIVKTICKSCHEYLHKQLLGNKRCVPQHHIN